jgi:hypothetical protein
VSPPFANSYEYYDIPGVFGIGNVVTGKGNIRDSLGAREFVAKHWSRATSASASRAMSEQ